MDVKFALYEKDTGNVFLILPDEPSNDDYLKTKEIVYNNKRLVSGIKWENVGIWQNTFGVELDEDLLWRYNEFTQEFIEIGDMTL